MSDLSILFPGMEALDDDININVDTTGSSSSDDVAAAEETAASDAETVATDAGDIKNDATETTDAATAFAHQYSDLCAIQQHIARFGVDRTFLALVNRNNVFGRALNLNLPAMESFEAVGSPYSPTSVACLEALEEGMWKKFVNFIKGVINKIKNFFGKIWTWIKGLFGNYEVRLGKFAEFERKVQWNNEDSLSKDWKEDEAYDTPQLKSVTDQYTKLSTAESAPLFKKAQDLAQKILKIISEDHASADLTDTSKNFYNNQVDIKDENKKAIEHGNGMLFDEDSKEVQDYFKSLEEVDKSLDTVVENMKKSKLTTFGGDAKTVLGKLHGIFTTCLNEARTLVSKVRSTTDQQTRISQATTMLLDKVDRGVVTKGQNLPAEIRSDITKSMALVQKIMMKGMGANTYLPRIIGIYFKVLSAIQSVVSVVEKKNS